jgi:N utilization substance protein A
MRLKLDQETLALSSVLERVSHVKVKDCFRDEDNTTFYFVVDQGDVGKAIGKGGMNIRAIQQELGKRVKIIGFSDNIEEFVKSFVYPLSVKEVAVINNFAEIRDDNRKTKSLLIGRDGKNLRLLNRAVKRFFNVEEVKVV